ncbi:MAG: S4 domain-containing protein, partial [Mucinivorans sp.]
MTPKTKSSFFRRDDSKPAPSNAPSNSRSDRPARSFDRSERPARSFDRQDRPNNSNRSERQERQDRPARPAREFGNSHPLTERVDRPARTHRSNESFSPRVEKPKKAFAPKSAALPSEMRLNRFIAQSGVCSRREADQLIKNGEIE